MIVLYGFLLLFLLLGLLSGLPFFLRFYPQGLVIGLFAYVLFVKSSLRMKLAFANTWTALGFGLVLLSVLVSMLIYGIDVPSLLSISKYVLLALSFPIFLNLFEASNKNPQIVDRIFLFFLAILLYIVLFTVYGSSTTWGRPDLIFLGGYNAANVYYLLFVLFLLRMIGRINRISTKSVLVGLAAAFIVLSILTKSRQMYLLFVFASFYYLLFIKRKRRIRAGILCLGVAIVLLFSSIGARLRETVDTASVNSTIERIYILKQMLNTMSPEVFLFGAGHNRLLNLFEGTTRSVHNGYLQLIFNGGIILFFGFCIIYLSYLFKYSKKGSYCRLFLYGFLFSNLFDSHLYSIQLLWLPAFSLLLLRDMSQNQIHPSLAEAAPSLPSPIFSLSRRLS